jgi:hypothetical protein
VAIGWDSQVDIIYLKDDAAAPVVGRATIRALEDVPIAGFVPKTSVVPPYTNWPLALEVVKDLDGDGCDELLASCQQYPIKGDFFHTEMQGVHLLYLQPPATAAKGSPLRRSVHIPASVLPAEGGPAPRFGATLQHLGDVDGDGFDDVAALARCDCSKAFDVFILHLDGNATAERPVKAVTPLGLDEATRYWLRGCRRQDQPTVRVGRQASTAMDVRFADVATLDGSFFVDIRTMGDLNGDGLPELLINWGSKNFYEAASLERNLVVSPLRADYRETRLLGALSAPDEVLNWWSFSSSSASTKGRRAQAGGVRAVKGAWFYWADGVELAAVALPAAIAEVPVKSLEEFNLLEFEHPVRSWVE